MEYIPQDAKTPPLPAVLIHGCPDIHSKIKQYFTTVARPPLHVIIENDISSIHKYFVKESNEQKNRKSTEQGFIKASWIEKHRYQRASVAVIIIKYEDLSSDVTSWTASIKLLEQIFACIPAQGVKVIIVPFAALQHNTQIDSPADRLTTLKNYFNLESKYIFPLSGEYATNDAEYQILNKDLKLLSQVVIESSTAYYTAKAHKIANELTQQNINNETSFWKSYKLANVSEFYQDWSMAIKHYQNAYNDIYNAFKVLDPMYSASKYIECLIVIEQVNYKIFTLLMHQKKADKAYKQFLTLIDNFKKKPSSENKGIMSFYRDWMSRQYEIIYDISKPSFDDNSAKVSLDSPCHPAHLLKNASESCIKARKVITSALTDLDKTNLDIPHFVTPGNYLGQFQTISETGLTNKLVTGVVLNDYLLAVESNKNLGEKCMNLLRKSSNLYQEYGRTREVFRLWMLMADEYVATGDFEMARKFLLQVIFCYRIDKWESLYGSCLYKLIEVSDKLNLKSENILYKLELSVLSLLSEEACKNMAQESLDKLLEITDKLNYKLQVISNNIDDYNLKRNFHQNNVSNPQDAGWDQVLTLESGFPMKLEYSLDVLYMVKLTNNLPIDIPISNITVDIFDQSGFSVTLILLSVILNEVNSKVIRPKETITFKASFKPEMPGDYLANKIQITIGNALITYKLINQNIFDTKLLSMSSSSSIDLSLPSQNCLQNQTQIKHVGEIPIVKIKAPVSALVGEIIPILITMTSKDKLRQSYFNISTYSHESNCTPILNYLNKEESNCMIKVDDMIAGEIWKRIVKLKVTNPGTVSVHTLLILHEYCKLGRSIDIKFEAPFKCKFEFMTLPETYVMLPHEIEGDQTANDTLIPSIPLNHTILIKGNLECLSPYEVIIDDIRIKNDKSDNINLNIMGNAFRNAIMKKSDKLNFIIKMIAKETTNEIISIGNLVICWKRYENTVIQEVSSEIGSEIETLNNISHETKKDQILDDIEKMEIETFIALPRINIKEPLICAKLKSPDFITAGEPFSYIITINNNTDYPEEFEINIVDIDHCVISGDHDCKVYILPQCEYEMKLQLVMHTAGLCQLPGVKINCDRMNCFVCTGNLKRMVVP